MDEPFNETTNDSTNLSSENNQLDVKSSITDGPYKNETLEKFITLCRSRLTDTPNRRKKRYSSLRRAVSRYNQSRHWNQVTFENLIKKFSCLMELDIEHEQANEIYSELLKELASHTGRSCSGRCRKKKKSKTETTLAKLEKSLAIAQRRINKLRDESSANTWEARGQPNYKLNGIEKKAARLTRKIDDLNKLALRSSSANRRSIKIENDDGSNGGNVNSDGDVDELNCLLKSVRLKECVKLKPKTGSFGCAKFSSVKNSYPKCEMVEIKKYDQVNQCYVSSVDQTGIDPDQHKFIVHRIVNPASSPSKKCSASDLKHPSKMPFSRTPRKNQCQSKIGKLIHKEIVTQRREAAVDLILDRFRHCNLNSVQE